MFVAVAIALAGLPAAAPQAPVAAGSYNSIMEVLTAAKDCRVQELRVSMYHTTLNGDARVFLTEAPGTPAVQCLNSWLTSNGRRLRLVPRWWKDDFTRDRP